MPSKSGKKEKHSRSHRNSQGPEEIPHYDNDGLQALAALSTVDLASYEDSEYGLGEDLETGSGGSARGDKKKSKRSGRRSSRNLSDQGTRDDDNNSGRRASQGARDDDNNNSDGVKADAVDLSPTTSPQPVPKVQVLSSSAERERSSKRSKDLQNRRTSVNRVVIRMDKASHSTDALMGVNVDELRDLDEELRRAELEEELATLNEDDPHASKMKYPSASTAQLMSLARAARAKGSPGSRGASPPIFGPGGYAMPPASQTPPGPPRPGQAITRSNSSQGLNANVGRSQSYEFLPGNSPGNSPMTVTHDGEFRMHVSHIGRGINVLSGSLRSAAFDDLNVSYLFGRGDVGTSALHYERKNQNVPKGRVTHDGASSYQGLGGRNRNSMGATPTSGVGSPAPNPLGSVFSRFVTTIPRAPRLSVFPSYAEYERESALRTGITRFESGMFSYSGREPSFNRYSSSHGPLKPFMTGISKVDGYTHMILEDEREEYALRVSNNWRRQPPKKLLADPDVKRCLRHRFNPKSDKSKKLYYTVIERYGTHFVSEIRFGHKAEMRWSLPAPQAKAAKKRAKQLESLEESFIRSFELWQKAGYPNDVSFKDLVFSVHHGKDDIEHAESSSVAKRLLKSLRIGGDDKGKSKKDGTKLKRQSSKDKVSSRMSQSMHGDLGLDSLEVHAGVHPAPANHALPKPPPGCMAAQKSCGFDPSSHSSTSFQDNEHLVVLGHKLSEFSEFFANIEMETSAGENRSAQKEMHAAIVSYIADMRPIRDPAAFNGKKCALFAEDSRSFLKVNQQGQLSANAQMITPACVFKVKRISRKVLEKPTEPADNDSDADRILKAPALGRRREKLDEQHSSLLAKNSKNLFGLRNELFGNKFISRSMTRSTFEFHRLQLLGPYETFTISGEYLLQVHALTDPSFLFVGESDRVHHSGDGVREEQKSRIVLVDIESLKLVGIDVSADESKRLEPLFLEDEPDVMFFESDDEEGAAAAEEASHSFEQSGDDESKRTPVIPGSAASIVARRAMKNSETQQFTPGTTRLLARAAVEKVAVNSRVERSNSTSSMYIHDTIIVPNVEELCRAGALWIRAKVRDGFEGDAELAQQSPNGRVFSEVLHPLTKQMPSQSPSVETIFHYLSTIVKVEKLPPEPVIMSFIFVKQACERLSLPLRASNWRRLVLSSLILSTKVWEDLSVWNVDFLDLFPRVRVTDLNRMEKAMLDILQFEVTVSASEYALTFFELRAVGGRESKAIRKKVVDAAPAGATPDPPRLLMAGVLDSLDVKGAANTHSRHVGSKSNSVGLDGDLTKLQQPQRKNLRKPKNDAKAPTPGSTSTVSRSNTRAVLS